GEIRETSSFVVRTHVVDAEYGFEVSSGRIHVHNPFELRMRMGELASLTMMDSAGRTRWLRDEDEYEQLLREARADADRNEFERALALLVKARRFRPQSSAVLALMDSVR